MSADNPIGDRTNTEDLSAGDLPIPDRGLRKTKIGTVVSNKMSKTAIVETVTRVPHPKFRKIVKQNKRFYVHDEQNIVQIGDLVRIMETRPLSKTKRWRLVEVLKH